MRLGLFASVVWLVGGFALAADPVPDNGQTFLAFIKAQAAALRSNDQPPADAAEWQQRRTKLRENLLKAWGGFPETPCELAPRKLGEIQRDGYRVEKLIFQTRSDVWMTANAYVPDKAKSEKVPAILHVHGHWAGAKQDRVVQSRCIGSVKHGFFVLVVDAFGAGERGTGKKLGEYHGEMTGATLFPIGLPLSGLQVYENMRAVDYLQTRPEVDGKHIGITGASGGGNQTMYAGAFDERFGCVVPTCSVGTYDSYLGAACCMCEVVPGAVRFTEEGDVLGLAAGRGLMVTNATRDAFQFSVGEAKKSFGRVESIAKLLGKPDGVKHTIIESGHDYNQPMREAMYGWMTRHLKRTGDGSPLPDPEIKTEDPESLRCFPGESRPDDYVTIPRFAGAEARKLSANRKTSENLDAWKTEQGARLKALDAVLGGTGADAAKATLGVELTEGETFKLSFLSEPGIALTLLLSGVSKTPQPLKVNRLAVLLDLEQSADKTLASDQAKKLLKEGWAVAVPELRAVGRFALPSDKIGHAPDHNSAEWSLWIGRPLLGQWAWDVRRALDVLSGRFAELPSEVMLVGNTTAGPIALCAAALDLRITRAVMINSLASYVTDEPYRNQRLGLMVPSILRDVGDIPHIAALIAPRRMTIVGGVTGGGQTIHGDDLIKQYRATREVFATYSAEKQFRVQPDGTFWDSSEVAR
ncbi:MAG: acetylxylan esterase [Planctomycetes bacterium]|nr:acetylxylan esterase [Planctomycetota bacterium]